MEKKSFNTLDIKTFDEVTKDTLSFISKRQQGLEPSLKVKSDKVNNTFLNGFDWGRIVTVAGLSGSGKSTLVRQWVREMIEINPQPFEVLNFQFEMLGVDEIARDLSSKLNLTVKDLYSAKAPLKTETVQEIDKLLDEMKNLPINIVDLAGTVSEIKDTIVQFVSSKIIGTDKGLVITIDHTLLIKKEDRQDDKAVIDELMFMLVNLKKILTALNVKVLIFVISQLNRNIEAPERVSNPMLHFPNKNDLFGASSIFNGSDYVIITHKPCSIDGIGNWYGPRSKRWPDGLPVFNPDDSSQPLIYLHVIKERFGHPTIIGMADELKFGRIIEFHYSKK